MRAALREQIDALGLYNRIFLMGPVSPIETEWSKGAIAAVSSDSESFGMTIVEAMHCGVPVVATDCPHGPGEIITHGQDGLLVPLDGGPDAYSQALLRLIADSDLQPAYGHRGTGEGRDLRPGRDRRTLRGALRTPPEGAPQPKLAGHPAAHLAAGPRPFLGQEGRAAAG